MAVTSRERYAVVSCHVERPLDDRVWAAFSRLQARRPGGFAIASLMRPPDTAAGEDEARWLERAQEAAARGPLGHHTHWTAPDHARPTSGGSGERVLEEARRIRELGLAPTLFCGGGWYTDEEVAEACAELGYVDCTSRASRPSYLANDAPWASLGAPARIRIPSGRELLSLPTTHSLGDLARVVLRPEWPSRMPRRIYTLRPKPTLSPFVHVYLHDTDLLDRRRALLLRLALAALSRRASRTDLDAYAAALPEELPEIEWTDVKRP
jgi:hypothetical protein